jgi:epoxyqueuosine reductase
MPARAFALRLDDGTLPTEKKCAMDRLAHHDILYNDDQLGPYPDHLLPRVAKPTNQIPGPVNRVSLRENPFSRALCGDYGDRLQEGIGKMTVRYPVAAALVDLQDHINSYHAAPNPVAERPAPIPEEPRVRSRHLKSLGYFLGADLVGIGRLAQSAVYSADHDGNAVHAPYEYAIVFLSRKDHRTLDASNGWDDIVDAASFQTYQRLALQTEVAANYLRRLGFDAVASNAKTYVTLMPQLILDAGLGEISRMGIVVNPFLGGNFKAAAVLTNLEVETDGYVDFGLKRYCESCALCAEQCPAGAIPRGRQTLHNGYYTWKLNSEACARFDITNKEGCVCGRCTIVCPWNRPHMDGRDYAGWNGDLPWLHRTVDEQRKRVAEGAFVSPSEYTRKWWFRLDDPRGDGELIVPTGKNRHKICRDYPIQE